MGRFVVCALRRNVCGGTIACFVAVSCGGAVETVASPELDPSIAQACARFLSCRASGGVTILYKGIGDCVWTNAFYAGRSIATGVALNTSTSCINAATTCDRVRACVNGDVDESACAGALAGRPVCSGNRRVTCVLGSVHSTDCTEEQLDQGHDGGGTCLEDREGVGTCGFASCGEDEDHCEGNTLVSCRKGVRDRFTCPLSSQCTAHIGGKVRCRGDGDRCSKDRCDGEDLVGCLDGSELRVRCRDVRAGIPSVCREGELGPKCVPSPFLACNPEDHVDRCNGTKIAYCDGALRSIDCASLGFVRCEESEEDGEHVARCR